MLALAALATLNLAVSEIGLFPADWNIGLAEWINEARIWAITNSRTHPLFTVILNPSRAIIGGGLSGLESVLLFAPWFALVALTCFLMVTARGIRAGMAAGVAMLYFGSVGLWTETIQTLTLMGVSVAVSLLVGIPTGIWAGKSPTLYRALRPVLDVMQTLPSFVYLLPVVLLFGIQGVPAVVATAIYAIPPAIRLSALGIRQVPEESIEASVVFGATPRQTLFKVEIPLAKPSIMAGINQTIMMALSMVVIASLIGAAGLGLVVEQSLRNLEVGRGLEAGLAVVLLAILLDRISSGLAVRTGRRGGEFRILPPSWQRIPTARRVEELIDGWARDMADWQTKVTRGVTASLGASVVGRYLRMHPQVAVGGLAVLVLVMTGRFMDAVDFPSGLALSFAGPVDAAVVWARDNLRGFTSFVSDSLTLYGTRPLRGLFGAAIVWPVVMVGLAAASWWAAGWRVSLSVLTGLILIGLLGMWSPTMDTVSQTIVAVSVALVVAIPLGLAASRWRGFERVMQPIYDTLQTIPAFIYLVPVMILFSPGRIPGIIASVLYAIPPGARLTTLGIRQVPEQTVEASNMFGATPAQTMWKVQIPLALPSMMAAVNQVVMMVLAMVVIAGMVGGEGLGLLTVTGFRRQQETGLGFEAGIAIVILAMTFDRITEGVARRTQPGRGQIA